MLLARIVGTETIQPATVLSVADGLAKVQAGSAQLTAIANVEVGEVFLCIRGEEVLLQQDLEEHTSARNQLPATVTSLVPEGALVRIGLDCGFPLTALVTRLRSDPDFIEQVAREDLGLVKPGEKVLKLPPSAGQRGR